MSYRSGCSIRCILKLLVSAVFLAILSSSASSEVQLTVVPDSIDFGHVYIGDTRDTTFTIYNTGDEVFYGFVIDPAFPFSDDDPGDMLVLYPADSHVVTVSYEPDSTVICFRASTIRIQEIYDHYYNLYCCGTGYIDAVTVEPGTLDFGNVRVGNWRELSFTITNDSLDLLTGTISESCEGFSIASGEGPFSIPQFDSLPVTVRFEPDSEDLFECTIETGNTLLGDVSCWGFGYIVVEGCRKEGDPGIYQGFKENERYEYEGDVMDVVPGLTYGWYIAPANFGFVSNFDCSDTDTFCLHMYDNSEWPFYWLQFEEPPVEECFILDPGYIQWWELCVTVPCEAVVGEYDTVIIVMNYCGQDHLCDPGCTDLPECEDPNWYGGNPYYSADTVILHVVEPPPALTLLVDPDYFVEIGQTMAYVPFDVCNSDPCAAPEAYGYRIESTDNIGGEFPQSGTTDPVEGGNCETYYSIIDAGISYPGTTDTLTIIAWDDLTGTTYDTAVQLVMAVESCGAPLFSPVTITLLVLALLLAAGVIMRRRRRGA